MDRRFCDSKQLLTEEIDDEEMGQDEMKVINTSVQVEEDKEQSATLTSTMVQTDDMAEGKSYVIDILTMHDDVDGDSRVEVTLKTSKSSPSCATSLVTPSEECQQPWNQSWTS